YFRAMRWVAGFFALGLMMALFHRLTAASPVAARAALALGFLLVAAWPAGEVARRARVPRITAFVLLGLCAGPAWLNLVRADEVAALGFVGDACTALIAFAAGSLVPLATLRAERAALGRLAGGTIAFPFAAVTLATLSVSRWFPLTVHQPFGNALAVALARLAGSLAVGVALGAFISQYLRLVRRDAALVLVTVAFVPVIVASFLQGEALLVALAAGIYVGSVIQEEAERLRAVLARAALPVYAVTFLLAGAGFRLEALADLWPWVLLLAGLRAVALRYGTLWTGRSPVVRFALAREGWLGLISQAGAVLGLATAARLAFPAGGISLPAV